MIQLRIKHLFLTTATICLLGIGSAALAQYVWLDEKGSKQYSDMPPPTSVPAKRILKMPGNFSIPSSDISPNTAESGDTQNGTQSTEKTPPTLAEQNAAFTKRQSEQAEKDKKAADSAKMAANKARNCDGARAFQRTLDSGQRIAQIDKNGQRAFFDDSQRNQATRDNKQALDDCK